MTDDITLGEGNTPLIRSRSIGPRFGLENLYFKLEMLNPSGSYKDRFAVSAVNHMRRVGETRCVATSSGNTGAALAAYCAAANIGCEIALVETAPVGKLKQMMSYGAKIYRVRGFGLDPQVTSEVFDRLEATAGEDDTAFQVSAFVYSPHGMAGVRSISPEIHSQLPEVAHVFCPTGGGGLAIAASQGFLQLSEVGVRNEPARVHAVQPIGNNTIAGPLRDGAERAQEVECTALISGLQVASITDGHLAVPACRQTRGTGVLVDDEFTWEIQADLARTEGVFCEPAAAISVAGAIQACRLGDVAPSDPMVCLITGMAFKAPESVTRMVAENECPLIDPADIR